MEAQTLDEAVRKLFGEADLLMLNETLGASIEYLLSLVPCLEDRTDQTFRSTSTETNAFQNKSEKPDGSGKPFRHVQIQERNEVNYPEFKRILEGNPKASPSLLFSDPYTAISKVKLCNYAN